MTLANKKSGGFVNLLLKTNNDMLFVCGQAEAQIADPAVRGVVAPIRHSAVPRTAAAVPTATTAHAVRARRRPCRVGLT